MMRRCLLRVGSAALALVLGGCVSSLVGGPAAGCSPGMLAVSDPDGASCLGLLERSQPVARWMAENGAPDYIEAASSRSVRFFYIERDATVSFGSGWVLGGFEPRVNARIHSLDHSRFSDADRARLGNRRMDAAATPIQDELPPGGGVLRRRVGDER